MQHLCRPLAAAALALAALLPAAASAANSAAKVEKARAGLGAAPEGFEWQVFGNLAVLQPAGWNRRESADTLEFSPEAFVDGQPPEHGWSVQVLAGYKAANGMVATQGLLKTAKPILDRTDPRNMLVLDKQGSAPKMSLVLRYRVAPLGEKPVLHHQVLVADDKADTLTITSYHCPERDWKANWPVKGTVMMEAVKVLPGLSARP